MCVPLGREQPQNAAAVARAGAGTVVEVADVTRRIRSAVEEVLVREEVRASAGRLAAAIAATGPDEAVRAVLGTG